MILCCGEALIDMLPRQLPGGEKVYLPVAGGAIFNTAITLGRLGAKTGFLSGLSSDMFGDVLLESLKASDVDTSLCVLSERPTTLAFVKLRAGNAEYRFYDEGSAGRMLSPETTPDIPNDVLAMHFGAISLISEPCGSAYESLAIREAPRRLISLDPNIRPGFISDQEAHRARIGRMAAIADIVKVSHEDLGWLAGDATQAATIERWLGGATSVVIVTRGNEGASLHTRHGTLLVAAKETRVVDTVGAGDSFNGGFLHGLSCDGLLNKDALSNASPEMLRNAAELAASVAAITISRPGANPPWAEEIA